MLQVKEKYIGYLERKTDGKVYNFVSAPTQPQIFHSYNQMMTKDDYNLVVERHLTIVEKTYGG